MILDKRNTVIKALIFLLMINTLMIQGCAIFFPDRSSPKSENYYIQKLSGEWREVRENSEEVNADLTFEHKTNGAVISLNSICRKYEKHSLEELTNSLVMGIKKLERVSESFINIDGIKAKNVIFLGEVENIELKIRTVVLKKDQCMYDFIYVVQPSYQKTTDTSFETFLASFKIE